MNKLRVHVEKAREILKTWRGAAKAFAGRLGLHAAKTLPALKAWVGQASRLKLGLAALAVLLTVGIVFAAVSSQTLVRHYRAISSPGQGVPLPGEIRRAAAEKAKQLAAALEARIDKKGKFAGEAWISA
ncbi:MAG TPA: hypothetical protein VI643_07900, partial [Planctomycetota bacterium]|nr:hypothetical protein [Planctomycetota bacterium]